MDAYKIPTYLQLLNYQPTLVDYISRAIVFPTVDFIFLFSFVCNWTPIGETNVLKRLFAVSN